MPRTTKTEQETEPETDTDTETKNGNGNGTFNICDFGLSTRIRSFLRVIFFVCLSVYFLDIWRFLYLPKLCETYILVFKEGLCMGDKMDHTLVNPNQMRHFGIKVQDNPYDGAPLYLMTEDGDFFLPLAIQGTNIMEDTHTPT